VRNGDVSFWWHAQGLPPRHQSLPASTEADVCIVGGGYTGLWTAYYLKRADPELRVVVLEAAFAGFGASGRNGGWVTASLPGSRARYARGPRGTEGVRALEQALRDTVDEVARVCTAEGIDASLVKGGTLSVATSPAQDARLRERLGRERAWGDGEDVISYLDRDALSARLRVAGGLGALFEPDCARIQPAALVAGLAEAAVRAGAELYEATPVTAIEPGRARTQFGDVRARHVLRCTEGFTARLPGQRRRLLPMNSAMIVTEPLSDAAWDSIGWDGCETLGDEAHAYMYAQRTADGRIALGGRGVPYRFGSGLDDRGEVSPGTAESLARILRQMFPAAASAGAGLAGAELAGAELAGAGLAGAELVGIEHAWCGVLGVPRDWCAAVNLDQSTGLGWAGGYSGQGVAASNLAGRTLADLVRGADSPLVTLPWVGHRSASWEPEPLRWTGVHSLYTLYRAADRLEARSASSRTSPLAHIADQISRIPH
jgi:glycine/D-amino acid oxidase-like deaminating enzyme